MGFLVRSLHMPGLIHQVKQRIKSRYPLSGPFWLKKKKKTHKVWAGHFAINIGYYFLKQSLMLNERKHWYMHVPIRHALQIQHLKSAAPILRTDSWFEGALWEFDSTFLSRDSDSSSCSAPPLDGSRHSDSHPAILRGFIFQRPKWVTK